MELRSNLDILPSLPFTLWFYLNVLLFFYHSTVRPARAGLSTDFPPIQGEKSYVRILTVFARPNTLVSLNSALG